MRMMLRVAMPTETSNKAIKEDLISRLVQQTAELIKPEAAYFASDKGVRTAYFFFDMKDSSQMPQIAEPWFHGTGALIEMVPCMNVEDLRTGLEKWKR